MSSYTDAQVRTIINGLSALLTSLGSVNIGPRGRAAIVALDAIGGPTAAPGDPGSPPPTSPFPPPGDTTAGGAEVIRRASYGVGFGVAWELVVNNGSGKLTYKQVP